MFNIEQVCARVCKDVQGCVIMTSGYSRILIDTNKRDKGNKVNEIENLRHDCLNMYSYKL